MLQRKLRVLEIRTHNKNESVEQMMAKLQLQHTQVLRCPTTAPQAGLGPAEPAPGSSLPHLHWDRARPCQTCVRTGLTASTSAGTWFMLTP
jgi:hypothetical protein